MSRRLTLIDAMGIGPAWYLRGHLPQHEEAGTETAAPPPAESAPPLAHTALPAAKPTPVPPAPAASEASAAIPPDWPTLQAQVAQCRSCALSETRKHAVFGRGNPKARWMLIGEAPGEQEDQQGEPFVGRAGQLLDNMLKAAGLDRETDVYIANVLKCRPPGNRNPQADEIASCRAYLDAQIAHVRPELILALGRFAAQTLLSSTETIGRLRGRVHDFGGIPLIATFHPAYLLRNQPDKARAWQDLLLARHTVAPGPR